MKKSQTERLLEIIPGALSWLVILFFLSLFILKSYIAAIVLIVYLIYWASRLLYGSSLLIMAHHKMISKKNIDWLKLCSEDQSNKNFNDIIHVVLFTIYKEPLEVLEDSLNALKAVHYPKKNIIVVLAGEDREEGSLIKLEKLKSHFEENFKEILISIHPKDVPGELPCKGANATYAAKKTREYLKNQNTDLENVIISCFDADTRPDKSYFSCLTYHFLTSPNRHRLSFQPLPIYSNNIYRVTAFARAIEMGSTFWQLIESMHPEKFVTFSSHSMSFKTLVDVNYWPVDLVSDDSLIYWKCYLKYNGDYSTRSLDIPVYMDIAEGTNFFNTMAVQYKQKRRWAWGVETFVFVAKNFLKNKHIRTSQKISKLYQILDNHINWATWAIIISFITPAFLWWVRSIEKNSLLFLNLSYVNNVIFHALTIILILSIFISKEFLPPKPKNISNFFYVSFILQWLLIPFFSAILGSLPSLDAQTRMMFGLPLDFYPTPKLKK